LHTYVSETDGRTAAADADVEVLLLTYEELASNAVRHGRSPVVATVTTTDDGWLIDVVDGAAERAPSPAIDRDPALGGLGLHLVARLCAAHGWWVERNRKHVWARVRRTRA
jgi:anti-sigma regulatory factor (Ser/Thr protein kinase)